MIKAKYKTHKLKMKINGTCKELLTQWLIMTQKILKSVSVSEIDFEINKQTFTKLISQFNYNGVTNSEEVQLRNEKTD